MGTPEMVVKRAWPCSSTLTPVGAPMGRSGDFSSVGANVFSAHFFSAAEGWRFSKTSTMGLFGYWRLLFHENPGVSMIGKCGLRGKARERPVGCVEFCIGGDSGRDPSTAGLLRFAAQDLRLRMTISSSAWSFADCTRVPMPWSISTRRRPRGRDARAGLRGRRGSPGGKSSCK